MPHPAERTLHDHRGSLDRRRFKAIFPLSIQLLRPSVPPFVLCALRPLCPLGLPITNGVQYPEPRNATAPIPSPFTTSCIRT